MHVSRRREDTPMTGTVAPFRFGVVTPVMTNPATWRDELRRIADHGYSTLLMPDVPGWQPAPGPALAVFPLGIDLIARSIA